MQPIEYKDGTNRSAVKQYGNFVVINVYMPCHGGKYTNADFQKSNRFARNM